MKRRIGETARLRPPTRTSARQGETEKRGNGETGNAGPPLTPSFQNHTPVLYSGENRSLPLPGGARLERGLARADLMRLYLEYVNRADYGSKAGHCPVNKLDTQVSLYSIGDKTIIDIACFRVGYRFEVIDVPESHDDFFCAIRSSLPRRDTTLFALRQSTRQMPSNGG